MQTDEILKDIRTRCRMAMNGVASTSMRERGLAYKLNFGLVIQQIKDLATRYEASAQLAGKLWAEDTRELKILGTLLYPVSEFLPETANRWATEIDNQEIREQVCLNLFQQLDYADQLAIGWSKDAAEDIRTTGYWLMTRLLLTRKYNGHISATYFPTIWNDILSENIFLRNASLLVLKHIVRHSRDEADAVLDKLKQYKDDESLLKREAYDSISFEIEFIYN